ncbi:MAG: two-component regulator propeller domain-containing protein [Chitinophagaceae bacterium]
MSIKYLYKILLLVSYVFYVNTLCASDQPNITYLGIEQGLSNNSVTCSFQDHKGFIWFGTYDGLNRYDGYDFRVFRNRLHDTTSLPNNRVAVITEDFAKTIWVGTRSGAAKYDEVTSSFSSISYISRGEKLPKKITATVNAIKTDAAGTIFIATDEGLFMYEENSRAAAPVFISGDTSHASFQAMAVECDSMRRVWIYVREKGLYLYNPRLQSLQLVNAEIKSGICLESNTNGSLLLGADDGLYNYSTAENKFSKLFTSGNRIVQVSKYNNLLYISSDGNGIFTMNISSGKIEPLIQPLSKKQLSSICTSSVLKDVDGRLWIGTFRGGINVLDPQKNKFRTIAHDPLEANSLIGNFVTSCSEDADGNLWLGTDGNGISCWNRKKNTFASYRYPLQSPQLRSSNFVTDILIDFKNNIWLATWGGGVNRFNKKSGTFEHFNCVNTELRKEDRNQFILYQDKHNTLWAGSCLEGGLYYFNDHRLKFELYDYRLKNILAMYEDNSGQLWAGDFSSLILVDQVKKQHRRYELGYAIRSILEDQQGNFWVGTEGGGLLLFDRSNGRFTRFSETEGLSNNSILKILADKKNNLWISTFNGISLFNTITKKFSNFSQSDGLQSNQFNYNAGQILRSGEFVFGGIKGLNIFYPDSVINRLSPPAVLLTGLKVNNKTIQYDKSYISKRSSDRIESITLPFDKAVLAIDFVALNYTASDKIKYAYYLEGWDKGWNYVGKIRTANYTRINEGSYTFHVKACSGSGAWSEWQEHLVITILPPWYRAWWAYLLYITIASALIYTYVRYKSISARQSYEIALAKIETEKQKELNEKKLSFFTNISHEFRAPLTLIINPVKELLHHPEKKSGAVDLHLVYRNARRLLSLVDQLLLFRKADTEGDKLQLDWVNFYELCQEVYVCFSHQAKTRNINYQFSGSNHTLELLADKEKIEIILFNLLSNALKFTPPGGTVSIEIAEKHNIVELTVSDTGCGIDPGTGNRLFEKFYQSKNGQGSGHKGFGIGLFLVNQFVQAHKGTISYKSTIGEGTSFIIQLPVPIANHSRKINEHLADEDTRRKPLLVEELLADLEADTEENASPEHQQNMAKDFVLPGLSDMVSEKKIILLVDDDTGMREYLGRIFAGRFLVYEAANGESGMQMAEAYVPDIIISDVIMDGMNGVDFCNRIKTHPELNHIPVILLTATSSSDIKLKGIECGAEDYITKPFENDLLVARVDNILKNRNAIQQYFLDTITLRKNGTKVSAPYREFLDRCIFIIEKEILNEDFTIRTFAREMGMSHSSLYKKVKSISGLSLTAFIRFLRLRKAALLLLTTSTNINEVAIQVGINDVKYFRVHFQKLYGMNPSAYIKKYKDSFNRDFSIIS